MPRFLAPAGAPLSIKHIARACVASLSSNGDAGNALGALAMRLHMKYFFPTCSGRAGLLLVLKALHSLRPDRNVAVLPAYTCFSVPAAIVRAGLKLQPIDIDLETLDYDFDGLAAVPEKNLLCIVTSHLFGLVNDLRKLQAVARAKGAFLVDDAAQALGGARAGIAAGAGGDVGFYSFGRGKVLGAVGGGLVVTNSEEIARAMKAEFCKLSMPSWKDSVQLFTEMLSYSILLKPSRYWMPDSMPFLKLGTTEFNPNFQFARMSPLTSALISQLLCQVERLNAVRASNARCIALALNGNSDFFIPKAATSSRAIYVRLPALAKDAITRTRALERLRAAGIGATAFYPSAICDIPGIERHMAFPTFHRLQAESLARRLMTLPTHAFVTLGDISRMVRTLSL